MIRIMIVPSPAMTWKEAESSSMLSGHWSSGYAVSPGSTVPASTARERAIKRKSTTSGDTSFVGSVKSGGAAFTNTE